MPRCLGPAPERAGQLRAWVRRVDIAVGQRVVDARAFLVVVDLFLPVSKRQRPAERE